MVPSWIASGHTRGFYLCAPIDFAACLLSFICEVQLWFCATSLDMSLWCKRYYVLQQATYIWLQTPTDSKYLSFPRTKPWLGTMAELLPKLSLEVKWLITVTRLAGIFSGSCFNRSCCLQYQFQAKKPITTFLSFTPSNSSKQNINLIKYCYQDQHLKSYKIISILAT